MSAPAIGALRRRVTIEAPHDTPDGIGGITRDYAPVARVYARIEATRGESRFVEQRQEQSITHVATIRWRSDVTSQMRFAFSGHRLLIHAAYDLDERRRFLVCQCEEIAA